MKKKIIYSLQALFILVNIVLFLPGCATVENTIYLGDIEVSAPITPPPTHLNINKETGDVTISPRFSVITSEKKIVGSTGDQYSTSYKLPDNTYYKANKENLKWEATQYTFGADLDIKAGEKISLFGGINFSSGNKTNLTGGNLGIGFHNHLENPILRFDIGINIQKYNYFAVTIVQSKVTSIFGTDEYTNIYGDRGNSVNINPFISLTVNSANDAGFINYFGIIGFFTQSLLGYHPGETEYTFFPLVISETTVDESADFTATFLFFNPGLSFSLADQIRILLSSKILKEFNITNSDWVIMPSLQMDFQL